MRELWSAWTRLRHDIDVTLDDTAIDGTAAGRQLTDFSVYRPVDTSGGATELPREPCTVQLGFYGAAPEDGTASFGCEIWLSPVGGPCQKICDITGLSGNDWADFTEADTSARLFYEDLTVHDTTLWGDITTRNLLKDGMGIVEFTSRGMTMIYPRFYNVGDGTECERIKALMRAY